MGAGAVRWALVARCLPTVGSYSETFLRSRTQLWASQAFRLLGPRPRMGSPAVVPDSIIMGRLSKCFGAQPSNPWIVIGSEPGSFIRKEKATGNIFPIGSVRAARLLRQFHWESKRHLLP